MNANALFKISYGLFILTAEENGFDNGCVINTLTQQTGNPCTVSVTVNKSNKTCEMIKSTGKFNVSVISTKNIRDIEFEDLVAFLFAISAFKAAEIPKNSEITQTAKEPKTEFIISPVTRTHIFAARLNP